jgi:uncharacterized membrane protein
LRATGEPDRSFVTVTHVIYGLHAASLVTGIVTAASIVFAFIYRIAKGWLRLVDLRTLDV